MRIAFPVLAVTLVLSGCSVSAGAGVGARLGNRPVAPNADCVDFESCDVAYQEALATLERCREDGADCDDEERNTQATYSELREQTQREIEALRAEAEEREAALARAEQSAAAAPREGAEAHSKPALVEPTPEVHHGNGWFDSEY